MTDRPRKVTSVTGREPYCSRCGIKLTTANGWRFRPTSKYPSNPRIWCQPCGEKVPFGFAFVNLDLDGWLGKKPKPPKRPA